MSTRPATIEDYRILAQRRLPKIIFDYLEGGADDETGLKDNHKVFERYRLMLRRLVDVSKRETGIELFGLHQAAPFMIGPTGLNGALWPRATQVRGVRGRQAGPHRRGDGTDGEQKLENNRTVPDAAWDK